MMKKKYLFLIVLLFTGMLSVTAQNREQLQKMTNAYVETEIVNYDISKLNNREVSGLKSKLKLEFQQKNKHLFSQEKNANRGGFIATPVGDGVLGPALLVQQLFTNSCATFTNIESTSSGDSQFGSLPESLGSFTNGSSNIPFNSGMILSTGFINQVQGPNDPDNPSSNGNAGAWASYADPFITQFGEPGSNYRNGTTISFNFTPIANHISFDFMLLSEEYNQQYECNFADLFVFVLEDLSNGTVQNLAVVPNSNTPIQVTSIRPTIYFDDGTGGVQCVAVNEPFFSNYNYVINPNPDSVLTIPAAQSPTSFNGQTHDFTAFGDVIPNQQYRITIAIADEGDATYDSAILIENGSFNVGIELGPDIVACVGESSEIGVPAIPNATYQWQKLTNGNFVNISGATQNTYTVTESGEYRILVTANGCSYEDTITVTISAAPVAQIPDDITICDETPNDGFGIFDLTSVSTIIQNGQTDATVSFHTSLADANANVGSIASPGNYENTTSDQQTIYARLTGPNGCYTVINFNIIVEVCCTTVRCPDIYLSKTVRTISPKCPRFDPGDQITFNICVRNDEVDSCPISTTIEDTLDPQFFDMTSFNPVNFSASIVNNSFEIQVDDLAYQEQRCYTFRVNFRDDVLPAEGQNCTSITKLACQTIESCAQFCLNLPNKLWPRTFGAKTTVKRYPYDLEQDDLGNTYVVGLLANGDTSFEDPNFTATSSNYIMKFDMDGNLLWTRYLTNTIGNGKKVKYFNNHIFITTSNGYILKYNLNGTQIDSYKYGYNEANIDIDTSTGNIFLTSLFTQNFPNNGDYFVNVGAGLIRRYETKVFKFDQNFNYIHSVEFEALSPSNANNHFYRIHDIAYIESTNSLYVTGEMNGNVFIPENTAHEVGIDYFTIAINDNPNDGPELEISTNNIYEDEMTSSITHDNNTIYLSRDNEVYTYGINLATDPVNFYGRINDPLTYTTKLVYDSNTNSIFAAFNNKNFFTYQNSSVAKLGNTQNINGLFWQETATDKRVFSICLGVQNHIMVAGTYNTDTNFDTSYRESYSNFHDAFVARLRDEGGSSIFDRSQTSTETPFFNQYKFTLYPNPVSSNTTLSAKDKSTHIENVIVRDFYGKTVLEMTNVQSTSISFDTYKLNPGIYFVKIYDENHKQETIKMIVK
ncbi:choice-of-anchor L domain-containing protein [uncultured Kordia sp.]|uniref:choice-of-anchor L domain-containing protein n=1 Tax=uncultured Kordia sp. TaxID=507699 RepID=UPI002621F837|nr:choice-of-anchor L domain-containing protein [uncultured Kordia sp.]